MHNEHVQLCFATFSSLHNKIQWTSLTSHILYWQKQKVGQWQGNEATFTHHTHTALCWHHLWCLYFVIFIFAKNSSIGHWVCCCGKRMMMVLKPLSLWESVLSLIVTMAGTYVCLYDARQLLHIDSLPH